MWSRDHMTELQLWFSLLKAEFLCYRGNRKTSHCYPGRRFGISDPEKGPEEILVCKSTSKTLTKTTSAVQVDVVQRTRVEMKYCVVLCAYFTVNPVLSRIRTKALKFQTLVVGSQYGRQGDVSLTEVHQLCPQCERLPQACPANPLQGLDPPQKHPTCALILDQCIDQLDPLHPTCFLLSPGV